MESFRAHAAAQTAALASAAVTQRRMQCQIIELEKMRDTTTTSLAADNEFLKQLLEEAREKIDALRNAAAEEATEAHDDSLRFSSQRQVCSPANSSMCLLLYHLSCTKSWQKLTSNQSSTKQIV